MFRGAFGWERKDARKTSKKTWGKRERREKGRRTKIAKGRGEEYREKGGEKKEGREEEGNDFVNQSISKSNTAHYVPGGTPREVRLSFQCGQIGQGIGKTCRIRTGTY